jgi:hypothetical protein
MGLSNYKPNSRLAQAGVVPNAAARPASPYEGQVIFQVDTKRTLVWDGVAWVDLSTGTDNQPGLELITSCTATFTGGTAGSVSGGVVTIGSANTAVTVSDAFSSNYDAYRIVVSGVVGSAEQSVQFNFVNSSGTLISTDYRTAGISLLGSSTVTGFYNASDSQVAVGRINSSAASGFSFDVLSPNIAEFSSIPSISSFSGTVGVLRTSYHAIAAAYPSFRLTGGSGSTFTGGTIRVYGYRN